MLFKRFLQLCILFLLPGAIWAQVTTSSITGTVTDVNGKAIDGVTVTAVHQPTGTIFRGISREGGTYNLSNLKVGGPYTVTFSYVGLKDQVFKDIYLDLGNESKINATMQDANQLGEVVVSGKRNSLISKNQKGMSLQVDQHELQILPTISRSLNDFARLSPVAQVRTNSSDGSPAGISFGGQSTKYNQFTIDGANSTDLYGLSSNGTNGGQIGINPIPMDAIQELQVVLSPYDVTYGGFTGGGMNAVTKSGTNTLHGSVYGFLQNQNWVGNSADTKSKYGDFTSKFYGARLGGAIIKNKLFYFVNYEGYRRNQPVTNQPGTGSSNLDVATIQGIADYMKKTYDYDPGAYNGLTSTRKSNSLFARIDWNISDKNKLMVRNSYVNGNNYSLSDGANSMSFENNGYTFHSKTNSTVAELTSNINPKLSNLLRVTYTTVSDNRELASIFPSITVSDNGATYNIGSDYSSQANSLTQKSFTLTDNLNIFAGNHTLTAGTNNEFISVKNVFLQGYYGDYTYTSLDNFYADSINQYRTTYNSDGSKTGVGPKAAQFGLYLQDNWKITPNFNITYGVRADMPVYFNHPAQNELFNSSDIAISNGLNNTKAPKSRIMIAPRAGFNWDVYGNGKTQLRGGLGVFTGRVPLVWVANQYSQTGSFTIKETLNRAAVVSNKVVLNPQDPYRTPNAKIPASEVDITDRNFKNPQTFRANLAVDQKLPWGIVATVEGIYTKTIHDILYKDLNLNENNPMTLDLGEENRAFYNSARNNSNFTNIMYLTNTSKGYSYNVYGRLQKNFSQGWMASIAYSYGNSYGLNDGTSSTAYSNWRYAYNVNGLNNLSMARNNNSQGSRIVGFIGKTFKYGKDDRFATRLGLFYTGQSGQTYSYLFYGDINGDDGSKVASVVGVAQDIMYVPNSVNDFVDLKSKGTVILTAAQEFAAWQSYVDGDSYLKKNQGKTTKRNGARLPWENHFDFKIEQDVKIVDGHTITFTCNIMNVGNLLNDHWGKSYYMSNQYVSPLTVSSFTQSGTVVTPHYTFNPTYGNNQYTNRPWTYSDFGSRWNMQLGIRYSF